MDAVLHVTSPCSGVLLYQSCPATTHDRCSGQDRRRRVSRNGRRHLVVHNVHTQGQSTTESRGNAQLSPRTRVTCPCRPLKRVKVLILPIEQLLWCLERRCRGHNLMIVILNKWDERITFRREDPGLLVGAAFRLGFLSSELSAGAPSVRDPFSLAPSWTCSAARTPFTNEHVASIPRYIFRRARGGPSKASHCETTHRTATASLHEATLVSTVLQVGCATRRCGTPRRCLG